MTDKAEKEVKAAPARKLTDAQVARYVAEKRKLPEGVKSIRFETRGGRSVPIVVWK